MLFSRCGIVGLNSSRLSSLVPFRCDPSARLTQLKDFKVRPFWDFECGAEAGRKALGEAEEVLGKERKKLDAATHLCTLFEFPDAIKESQQMIADMESNCKLMYKVGNSGFFNSYRNSVVGEKLM